ncbi:type II toxin-antitoxin system prevent-host-death family antitoxin [Rhizobium sp. S152]|uniref:type II toxin-antitoxin system Phd/YefM family antitoxin n=1 Tax=Rhizobium sp. S152 TaxID=3055038 RepID=UPI0025A98159|nr:type II toxin-antitoxin system prevent-host-death family antitoxin [Rhizobium sp. S152]MDM9629249.1 type II toxin-antitoxin system prevent-host-death family antitoxin [Rhizobium sp. S152]
MTVTVNIDEASLPELLAKVEAGEEVVILRDGLPVARLAAVSAPRQNQELVDAIIRERAGRKPVTEAEIAEWKQIGRR